MINSAAPVKAINTNSVPDENQKGIENHKKAAVYLKAAAKQHAFNN